VSISIALSFNGLDADNHLIQFYDVAQALAGFERSLALTLHAVLNDEVITQAPSLKGAEIFCSPPEDGSWKTVALVVGGIWAAGQVSHDSVVGHIMYSAYDYVVSESLGVHVDFDKSLGQLYEESRPKNLNLKKLEQSRLDGVVEKCEASIKNMHRPIIKSESAESAKIEFNINGESNCLNTELNKTTFEYINNTVEIEQVFEIVGAVSSYNRNTFKGRFYSLSDNRPIPFELEIGAQNLKSIKIITESLSSSALNRGSKIGFIKMTVRRQESVAGITKKYLVHSVSEIPQSPE
jgi:hypothetical protein